MNNNEFIDFLHNKIVEALEREIPNLRYLNIDGDFSIKLKKIHIPSFSIIYFLEVIVKNKRVLELISKTKKSGDVKDYETAVFNEKQKHRAEREYKLLQEVNKVFNNKNGLNVPTPILYLKEFNTLIFTKAYGTDLGAFINQFEYSLLLKKRNLLELKRIIRLVATWLKYFHKHFSLEEMVISKEDLIKNIIFDSDKTKRWRYVPLEKVNLLQDQVLKKEFPDEIKLPCANLHGDFKYRHIWNNKDQSITVFDFGNEFEHNIIYEDLAGFLTETILLDYGINTNSINRLPQIIEDIFLETYNGGIDKDLLNLFIIRYLFKKWFKRRRRLYRFLDTHAKPKLISYIVRRSVEKYTDYYFERKINERLNRIA